MTNAQLQREMLENQCRIADTRLEHGTLCVMCVCLYVNLHSGRSYDALRLLNHVVLPTRQCALNEGSAAVRYFQHSRSAYIG